MRATTFCWKQGELLCFITTRAILEMSLRYGRLILTSLNTLALALSAYVCGLFLRWFYECCVYPLQSLQVLDARDSVLLLLSGMGLTTGSTVTEFSVCLFLRPTLMRLVPICASPFLSHGLPSSTSDCKSLPRCPLCCFSFQRSSLCLSIHTCSILRSTARRQVWSTLPWPVRICVGFSHFDRYESLWGWATLTSRKVCRVEPPWPGRMSVGWATLTSKNRCRGSAIFAGTNLCWVELPRSVRISAKLTYLDWTLSWLSSVPQDNCRIYIELYHDSFLRSPFYFVTNHFTNRRQCKLRSASLQKS